MVLMAEATPKYKTYEYVKAFQEHGWWQAKDIEPRTSTYRCQTGAMRARDRVGPPRLHGRHGDWKPGWFTRR
ncbi:MAG: hypothetical protein ACLT98_08250 [Eggerthellaceae bacterium]